MIVETLKMLWMNSTDVKSGAVVSVLNFPELEKMSETTGTIGTVIVIVIVTGTATDMTVEIAIEIVTDMITEDTVITILTLSALIVMVTGTGLEIVPRREIKENAITVESLVINQESVERGK